MAVISETADVMSVRSVYSLVRSERLIAHNLIVGSGSVLAGLLGFAFQSLFAHQLRPADYGAAFAVISLITLIGLPATAFTLLMARETSRDRAVGNSEQSSALLRNGNRMLLLLGVAIGAVLAISSPLTSKFLSAPPSMILAAAGGVPFGMALPLLGGEFQGAQRFFGLSALLAGQAGLKLIAAVALAILFGPVGVIAGISLAGFITYVAALWILRAKLSQRSDVDWLKPALKYLAIVLPSTLALALLLSADVILVKHYFASTAAGDYSAVAALGRSIFWGAAAVSAVLFPKVVFAATRGRRTSAVVGASLALVAAGGLLGLALLAFASRWLLVAFAGSAYLGAALYLPWYAFGMTLLGGVSVLIATHQSRGRAGFLAVLLPLAALEPILITAFHQSLMEVVRVVDISMALLAVCLLGWLLIDSRETLHMPAATSSAAQLGVYR